MLPTTASKHDVTGVPQTSDALFRAENTLFRTWQQRRPNLLRDGALGGPESTFASAPVRVLFALKEPNDSRARWSNSGADLRFQTAAFAELRSTFPVILLLTALAHSPGLKLSFEDAREHLRAAEARRALLRSIALVNLKKTPGGPVCEDRSLGVAVQEDGDLLDLQLALYRPHLTIAGGSSVFALLAQMRSRAMVAPVVASPRPSFVDPYLGLCLSFFHPQATKGFRTFYELLRVCLETHRFDPSRLQP